MLKLTQPVAITMWDFSWLERRWDGAGYEDWGRALDDLAERGYDAVRIDAYPHFVEWGPEKSFELIPTWHFCHWGAAMRTDVRILPALTDFIAACRERKIRVGLSTWFREDVDNVRMRIVSPETLARIWIKTLDAIKRAGLLDAILYLDLCNEWPGDKWAPFFKNDPPTPEFVWNGNTTKSQTYLKRACDVVRQAYPDVPLTVSINPDVRTDKPLDFGFMDFFEPHLWLAQQRGYYAHVQPPKHDPYDIRIMEAVAKNAAAVYRADPQHWLAGLTEIIDLNAAYSRKHHRGLMTTECWAIVDYTDGPRFDWSWVKEVCAIGTERAAASGRWLGIATSNFCGPQFVGMYRDIAWHQRLTKIIKTAPLDSELRT